MQIPSRLRSTPRQPPKQRSLRSRTSRSPTIFLRLPSSIGPSSVAALSANQMAQSLALAGRKLAGVANRTPSKAQAFAEQYGIEKVYDTVEDLYADPGIDAVYITTPHNTHITYLRAALAAGKHVLCEKAITLNSA